MFSEAVNLLVTHHLEPLADLPDEVDAVWVLFAPLQLVVWSVAEQRWANLLYASTAPGQVLPGAEDEVEFLVAVDGEFRRLIDDNSTSPYAFKLNIATHDDDHVAG